MSIDGYETERETAPAGGDRSREVALAQTKYFAGEQHVRTPRSSSAVWAQPATSGAVCCARCRASGQFQKCCAVDATIPFVNAFRGLGWDEFVILQIMRSSGKRLRRPRFCRSNYEINFWH